MPRRNRVKIFPILHNQYLNYLLETWKNCGISLTHNINGIARRTF